MDASSKHFILLPPLSDTSYLHATKNCNLKLYVVVELVDLDCDFDDCDSLGEDSNNTDVVSPGMYLDFNRQIEQDNFMSLFANGYAIAS